MIAAVHYNLAELSRAMRAYGVASGKTEAEVVEKQGGKLAWNIWSGMRKIMPAKGAVRAEQLTALASGRGVKVRPEVLLEIGAKYGLQSSIAGGTTIQRGKTGKRGASILVDGKRMNFQALAVKRELAIRESARGFSAQTTPRPDRGIQTGREVREVTAKDSRYGFKLADFGIDTRPEVEFKYASLVWLGKSKGTYESGAEPIAKQKQQVVIANAAAETQRDILVYVNAKIQQNINKFFRP